MCSSKWGLFRLQVSYDLEAAMVHDPYIIQGPHIPSRTKAFCPESPFSLVTLSLSTLRIVIYSSVPPWREIRHSKPTHTTRTGFWTQKYQKTGRKPPWRRPQTRTETLSRSQVACSAFFFSFWQLKSYYFKWQGLVMTESIEERCRGH